ncbi:hypothetical protein RZS08_58050, partial [Arthrospira platensis SPKY1]|nr:hypothetical protein [Arthrospira platensis SPKY1]
VGKAGLRRIAAGLVRGGRILAGGKDGRDRRAGFFGVRFFFCSLRRRCRRPGDDNGPLLLAAGGQGGLLAGYFGARRCCVCVELRFSRERRRIGFHRRSHR